MSLAIEPPRLPRNAYRFTVGEYERMVDTGILKDHDRVELLDGYILTKPREGSPTRSLHRFTVAEYERMVEVGILTEDDRVELIEGEILEKLTIGDRHAAAVNRLLRLLDRAMGDRAIVSCQNPIRLAHSVPEPDLVLLRPRDDFYASGKPGPADILLLIEVSDSSLDQDRGEKLQHYARNEIAEFWIVNLVDNLLEVHRDPRPGGRYARVRHLGPGESVEPAAFPGLSFAVANML